jgi:hypothetical protein
VEKIIHFNIILKMKRARTTSPESEPIEEHDSGFVGPTTLFDTFPRNDTFDETHELELLASPPGDSRAEVYTFIHNRQDYGVIKTEDAFLKAKISVHLSADGTAAANDQVISVNMAPLKFGWKSKEVYLNNQLISPQSSKENELSYVQHLMTSVPSNYKDEEDITLMIPDPPGQFNSVVGMLNGTNVVNNGMKKRYDTCSQDTVLTCIDRIDLLGYNKQYVLTSFDFKVVLTRLEKSKMLLGTAAHCALHDLPLCAP